MDFLFDVSVTLHECCTYFLWKCFKLYVHIL